MYYLHILVMQYRVNCYLMAKFRMISAIEFFPFLRCFIYVYSEIRLVYLCFTLIVDREFDSDFFYILNNISICCVRSFTCWLFIWNKMFAFFLLHFPSVLLVWSMKSCLYFISVNLKLEDNLHVVYVFRKMSLFLSFMEIMILFFMGLTFLEFNFGFWFCKTSMYGFY